jgi:hypothetical protein
VLFSLGFVWCELENFVALAYASGNRQKLTTAFTRGGTGAKCSCTIDTNTAGGTTKTCAECNAIYEWEEVLNDKHFVENVCDVALSKDWGTEHPSKKRPYVPLPKELLRLLKEHNENKFLSAVFFRRCVQTAFVFKHPRHAENARGYAETCALLALAMYHSSTPGELTNMETRMKAITNREAFMDDRILPQFMKLLKCLLNEKVRIPTLLLFSPTAIESHNQTHFSISFTADPPQQK